MFLLREKRLVGTTQSEISKSKTATKARNYNNKVQQKASNTVSTVGSTSLDFTPVMMYWTIEKP